MRIIRCISAACILFVLLLSSCYRGKSTDLAELDPGSYDGTWWNRTPIRLVQTNFPEIEGKMDRDEYIRSIIDASANTLLFNTGGIVANYQTRLPFQWKNPYIGESDLVADLIERLHKNGIRYIARFDFSKLDPSIAAQKPEWLYVGTDGKNQVFNELVSTCINGGYLQEYSFEILKEVIQNYPIDGIFFNMLGYTGSTYSGVNNGICQCRNCKKRFRAATGLKLPVNEDDPAINKYRSFQRETSEDLYTRITDFIRQQNPDLVIYNYNATGTSWIASESGASMRPGIDNIYHATINVKRTLGSFKDRTPVNLIMGFQAIGYRNIMSSPNLLRTWWLENMLHGAPVGFVVVGTLVHYEDRRFIPIVNELFRFHKKYEKLFTNIQSVSNIALLQGPGEEFQGMVRLLSEEHLMYDIISPALLGSDRMPKKLDDYDLVILGNLKNLSDDLVLLLDKFVSDGGKLLVTGAPDVKLKSLGIEPEYEVFPQSQATYLKISEDDRLAFGEDEFTDFSLMMMYSDFMKCRIRVNARGYMRFLPTNLYGPAEKTYYSEDAITSFPGAISYTYGQGQTLLIPWSLGSEYNNKGNYMHRALFLGAINNLLKVEHSVETDASPVIEMTRLANLNGAFEWVGMINHSGFLGSSFREPIKIHDTKVRIRALKPVKEVRLLRSDLKIKFTQGSGWVECTVPELNDFEMIMCLYK